MDANLAYEGLSAELKERLEGLHVTHDFREALVGAGHDYPVVAHPVVRTHRETGQKILWVNFTQRPQILGVELAESRALLDEVLRQYKRPEFQVRFSWRPDSVAFWDNRGAVHYARCATTASSPRAGTHPDRGRAPLRRSLIPSGRTCRRAGCHWAAGSFFLRTARPALAS